MNSGPFARHRQAKRDDRQLGHQLWRRCNDRFTRSLQRYWQIIERIRKHPGAVTPEEVNGLTHAGNLLSDAAEAVREVCVCARVRFPDEGLDIPAAGSDIHRGLSKAANDLAATAEAAAMFHRGLSPLSTVGLRAERVLESVENIQSMLANS